MTQRIVYYSFTYKDSLSYLRVVGPNQMLGSSIIKGVEGKKVIVDRVSEGDLVIFHRDFLGNYKQYNSIILKAHREGKPVVLDIDDLLFDLPNNYRNRAVNYFSTTLLPMMEALLVSDCITVSTNSLSENLSQLKSPVFVIPNYLNDTLWQLKPPSIDKNPKRKLTIGVNGNNSQDNDFEIIIPVIQKLINTYRGLIEVDFWGNHLPEQLKLNPQIQYRQTENWDYPIYVDNFQKRKIDIFITPLSEYVFNECKSPISYLENSALGIPGVYSNVAPYSKIIKHGKNGFLATSHDEWFHSIHQLIENPELRFNIAQNSQDDLNAKWLLSKNIQTWSNTYDKICLERINDRNKADISRIIASISQQLTPFYIANHERVLNLHHEITIKDEELNVTKKALTGREKEVESLIQQLIDLRNNLANVNSLLQQIYQSNAWKVSLLFTRLSTLLVPEHSLPAKVIGFVGKLFMPGIIKISHAFSGIINKQTERKAIELISASILFNRDYYLSKYTSAQDMEMEPAKHYYLIGWREGNNPSKDFDNDYYLDRHDDVRYSGICPLYHYLVFGQKERRLIRAVNSRKDTSRRLINPSVRPLVSVIVPNFNHAKYLKQRLDSIYGQTYQNFEVILLDDCSTDESVKILKGYQEKYPEKTQLFCNNRNSGNVFEQWKKGIRLSRGELVWIAESDDYCDNVFLEETISQFSDESVMLAYSHCVFVDENNRHAEFAFERYLSEVSQIKWLNSYVATAYEEVRSAFAIRNIIPNVSGAVFRCTHDGFALFNDPQWLHMRVCGDWLFYLNIIRGGKIAYCQHTHNYHRFHSTSASKVTYTQDVYYQEHEIVAKYAASVYDVPDDILIRHQELVKAHYYKNIKNGSEEKFIHLFDIKKVLMEKKNHKPNMLMVTYGFCLGGGEIYPIRLANALSEKGICVTMFNGNYEKPIEAIRKMLYPEIPVINYSPDLNLVELVSAFGIECIHTHHVSMEYLVADCIKKHLPTIHHVANMHGMYEMLTDDQFAKNITDIKKSVEHWFYPADKNLKPFITYGLYSNSKFTKISNGIDIPEINPFNRKDLGISDNAFVACLASRALPEKGWTEAIKMITQARNKTNRDMHLLLLGEGEVYDQLSQQKLPEYIHLLGFKKNVPDYFAGSDVGLLPTNFKGESFPLVIIECLMVGKPVIASNIGEINRMLRLDDQKMAGIVINLDKGRIPIKQFTNALILMSSDSDSYKKYTSVAKKLRQRYRMDRIADTYIKTYKMICSR